MRFATAFTAVSVLAFAPAVAAPPGLTPAQRDATHAMFAENMFVKNPTEPADVIRLPVPAGLTAVVVHPDLEIETARARELLGARALAAPSLAEVAAELDVAPVRLARAFRRAFGESPGDYVRRERIRIACERLATSDVGLAALAAELGFVDQSHFTRVFRRELGVTPGSWRSEHAPRRRRGPR